MYQAAAGGDTRLRLSSNIWVCGSVRDLGNEAGESQRRHQSYFEPLRDTFDDAYWELCDFRGPQLSFLALTIIICLCPHNHLVITYNTQVQQLYMISWGNKNIQSQLKYKIKYETHLILVYNQSMKLEISPCQVGGTAAGWHLTVWWEGWCQIRPRIPPSRYFSRRNYSPVSPFFPAPKGCK